MRLQQPPRAAARGQVQECRAVGVGRPITAGAAGAGPQNDSTAAGARRRSIVGAAGVGRPNTAVDAGIRRLLAVNRKMALGAATDVVSKHLIHAARALLGVAKASPTSSVRWPDAAPLATRELF